MTDKGNLKEFEKMFDLTSNNDDNEQAEEYGHSAKNTESFDSLVDGVNEELGEISDKGVSLEVESPHDIIADVCSKDHNDIEDKIKEPKINEIVYLDENLNVLEDQEVHVDVDFDILPEQDVVKKEVVEVIEEVKEVHDMLEDKSEPVKPILDELSIEDCYLVDGDRTKWALKSPSTMYEPFYKKKKIMLDICLFGGQIEYSKWTGELAEAQVSVVTENFDQQVIIRQMERVQEHRNRVKYIGVRVNNQYFLFKRFTPLLRGYLARVEYLKPALKQDGLVLEHMPDIEMYFERLESLHKSVADTENNLAAAYEMLSRKVTICMELPPVERYEKPSAKPYQSKFKTILEKEKIVDEAIGEMDDFDNLPTDAKASPKKRNVGKISWNEI